MFSMSSDWDGMLWDEAGKNRKNDREEEKKGGGKKRDDNMKNNVWMLDEMKEADPNKNLWHGVHQWEQSKNEEEVRKQFISNRSILWDNLKVKEIQLNLKSD